MTNHALRSALWRTLALSLLTSGASGGALAQDIQARPGGLEEVVVTARRREESLQSVPVAITALSGEQLQQNNVLQAQDLQNVTTGLIVQTNIGQRQSGAFTIRGQGQAFGGNLPGVITYFADVPLDSNGAASFVLDDMQSAQVLKGPQGTLFGRNTNGGAVLLTPHAPEAGLGGYVDVNFGNIGYQKVSAAANLPLGETVSVRVSGNRTRRDGFTTNTVLGYDADDIHSDAWRIFLRFQPSESFRSDLIYQDFQSEDNGTSFVLDYTNSNALGPLLAPSLAAQQAAGIRSFSSNEEGNGSSNDVQLLMNTTSWDLGAVALKNIISYQRVKVCYGSDIDGVAPPFTLSTCFPNRFSSSTTSRNIASGALIQFPALGADTDLKQITEELQVSGQAFDQRLNWIVGGFYLTLKTPGGLDEFRLSRTSMTAGVNVNIGSNQTDDESKALYAQGTYDLSGLLEGLNFTLGGRYTWDTRRTAFGQSSSNNGGVTYRCNGFAASGAVFDPATPIDSCYTKHSGNFNDYSYTVSLDYKINQDVMIYATSRRGFKSGGFNTVSVDATPEYNPEIATDVELGLKGTWNLGDVQLLVNADVFRTKFEGLQRQVVLLNPTPAISITNDVRGNLKGLEFDGVAKFGEHFELAGTYTYSDDEYTHFVDLGLDASSSPFPAVPEKSWSATGRIFQSLGGAGDLMASVSYYSTDRMQFESAANAVFNPHAYAPAYNLLSARLEWDNALGHPVTIALWGSNLQDREYVIGGLGLEGLLGFNSRVYGPPRTYGVTVSYKFGAEN